MNDMVRSNKDNYDELSDIVRKFCADRLYDLERGLRPYIDGSFGEIQPGHLSGYVSVLRELAKLYNAHKPPRPDDELLPRAAVEAMLHAAQLEAQARMEEAVAAAQEQVRRELLEARTVSIEAAKSTALAKLQELKVRVPQRRG